MNPPMTTVSFGADYSRSTEWLEGPALATGPARRIAQAGEFKRSQAAWALMQAGVVS